MKERNQSSIYRTSIPSTWRVCLYYLAGTAVTLLLVFVILEQSPASTFKGWLAIANVGLINILLCRAYVWACSRVIGYRWIARILTGLEDAKWYVRLLLYPILKFQAILFVCVAATCGVFGIVVSQQYHSLVQPPIDMAMLDICSLFSQLLCCYMSLRWYFNELRKGNTPMTKAMEEWKRLSSGDVD